MLYLRIFLIYPDAGGDLQAHISSEYEEFKFLWDDLLLNEHKSALVHIGFTRPDNEEIVQVFRRNPGKILFTSAAVSILSNLLEIKTSFVESLFKENFYVLGDSRPNGPDIEILQLTSHQNDMYPDWVIKGNSFNWFRNFEEGRPDLAAIASQSGIKDDLSYQFNESKLPLDIRVELAYARFLFITDVVRLSKIKDFPRVLPPWTLNNSINIFNFSVRTQKRMELQNIQKVSDFVLYSDEDLLKIPGVGRNVINEIRTSLSEYASLIMGNKSFLLGSINSDGGGIFAALKKLNQSDSDVVRENPLYSPDKQSQDSSFLISNSGTLLEVFKLLVSSLDEVQRTVIEYRSGLIEPQKTLQEVAPILGITRERVRQIQKKASLVIMRQSNLGIQIKQHLDNIRKGMVVPLKVSSLPSYDSWFKGCDEHPHVFEFILDLFNEGEKSKDSGYVVSNYEDLGIIIKGDIDTLEHSVKDLIDYIKGNVNKGVTKAQIKEKIEYFASIDEQELVDFIFYEVTEHAIFSQDDNGNELLIYYGQGIEAQIIGVLSNSNAPLNVSDIAESIKEKFNPLVEIEYVRNHCQAIGYLFARSTYGLQKHLPFSQQEIEDISERAKGHMESLPASRQWRSNEILEDIPDLENEYGDRLNHYTMAMILDLSKKVTSHGKMLFSLSNHRNEGRAKRVEFIDLVEAALEKSDVPLTRSEIYDLVSKDRGLSSNAQIQPIGRLVSCGRGVWGLLDKHLGLTEVDFEIIIEDLVNVFKKVKQGLDYEELVSRLLEGTKAWQLRNTPVILFSLATKSKKFKVSDIFLFPSNWPGPFRTTQRIALVQAYDDIPLEGMTLSDILDNASLKYGHPIIREVGYGLIREMGASYDESTGRWLKNK